jgi:hypothetical protein
MNSVNKLQITQIRVYIFVLWQHQQPFKVFFLSICNNDITYRPSINQDRGNSDISIKKLAKFNIQAIQDVVKS